MLPANSLKEKLEKGKTVIGTWSSLSSPNVANVIGTTGLDFVIFDLEHGPSSFETVENILRAVQTTECLPIIRTTDDKESNILRCLETGCQAIMVPHIENPQAAERVVRSCKYHPEGNRGMAPYTRHHDYCHDDLKHTMAHANKEIFIGILVEGEEGIGQIDEIAKTPNLDMIYMGIYDISQAVGVPGELNHPKVKDGLKGYAEVIKDHGLAAGSYAPDTHYAEMLINAGYQFIAYYNDSAALRSHYVEFLRGMAKMKNI